MELYEFAKQLDVIVIFVVLYSFGIMPLVYWIMEFLHWCWQRKQTGTRKRQ